MSWLEESERAEMNERAGMDPEIYLLINRERPRQYMLLRGCRGMREVDRGLAFRREGDGAVASSRRGSFPDARGVGGSVDAGPESVKRCTH